MSTPGSALFADFAGPGAHRGGKDNMTPCTYIFLDEAGNLDFSTNGTPYFILTSVSMRRPFLVYQELDAYRHDCLEYGLGIEYFHCSEDNTHVRNSIFDLITKNLGSMRIDCLVVEKRKTGPALQDVKRFYPEMLGYLLKFVVSELGDDADDVIVITDTVPVNKKRRAIEKGVQLALAKMLPQGRKYHILHHASRSHYGLQVADYCCWAVFRKWQRNETGCYDLIKEGIRSEFDIFRNGTKCYY